MVRTDWEERYARRSEWMSSSIIREILKFAERPDIISLAGGWPDADLFPVKEMDEIVHDALMHNAGPTLQYGVTEGYKPFRTALVKQMAERGITIDEDNLLVTSGAQQALDLVGRLLIDPGDTILVEKPTYLGAIQAWRAYGARFATIDLDDGGMRTDLLEEAIREHQPKFIYTLPNFHNPAGVTMSLERRKQLVALANSYAIAIVEDDPYGQLRYEGDHLPPVVALDAASNNSPGEKYLRGNVIYAGTFSKILAPGLRLGWIVAPPEAARQLVRAKQGTDLHTSTLSQMIAYQFCERGLLPAQVERIRETYRIRRDAMLEALQEYFPPGVRWTRPEGGLFLWVMLPEGFDSIQLLQETLEKDKVAFVPGTAFYTDGSGHDTLRLTFASSAPEVVKEGVKRLGRAIASRMPQ